MAFLSDLGKIVNEQFNFGENNLTTVDTVGNDKVADFGKLGDFLDNVDRSAQRTYIEDGLIRNVRPRMREIVWQQPDMTVVVKKRLFSSLIENFRLDLMEDNEKLFIRATKRLFQNKTRLISNFERLTKIENFARETGKLNPFVIPQVLTGISELENAGFNIVDANTKSALDTLRKVFAFSEPSRTTSWLTKANQAFTTEVGEGTGAMEFTVAANVNTTVSTQFGGGGASLSFEDPYKLMMVTKEDINNAILDATSKFEANGFSRFAEVETERLIDQKKQELFQLRASRNASQITFITSPETALSKKVRAIIDREGEEINFQFNPGILGLNIPDFEIANQEVEGTQSGVEIDPSAFLGPNGLTEQEASVFGDIIRDTFLLLGLRQIKKRELREFNEQSNYVRRKMMLHFAGKAIIQPMDVVNIFISSKSQLDDKLTKGFENVEGQGGVKLGQKIDTLLQNIDTNLGNLSSSFGNDDISMDEIEKASIVGADFPTWLWRLFRNDFTRQGAGVTVFVGLASEVSENYSNGKYVLNVSCEDNSGYFNKGQTNIRPAPDVFNGTLYDPLTPFDVSFDAATGVPITDVQSGDFPPLLQENAILLNSEAVKFKNGRFRGQRISERLYKAKDGELSFKSFRRVLNDPDGLVYRWKEGIASLTKTERAYPSSSIREETSPNLSANPFAGQDVMNVLSLLITGQPYNFNTFMKAAISNANPVIGRNAIENTDSAITFLDGLTNSLVKRNSVWGSFVPFKKLTINESTYRFIQTGQADFVTRNQRLQNLMQERAQLADERFLSVAGLPSDSTSFPKDEFDQLLPFDEESSVTVEDSNLARRIEELDDQISREVSAFDDALKRFSENQPDGRLNIIGDDVSLDPSFTEGQNSLTEGQRQLDRKAFRDRIDFLTLRRLWKVKGNEDVNLFIVDDQYDKNFDIQAFERRLGSLPRLFESEFVSIDSKIREVAKILDLEVFADSQGHIQARPHLYNRIPSSVFHRMFRDKNRFGIQVFPQFLESLFFNQLQGLVQQLQIIEDEIRLRGTALGLVSSNENDLDAELRSFLRGSSFSELNTESTKFSFVSDPVTGEIGSKPLQLFLQQSKPDDDLDLGPLKAFSQEVKKNLRSTRIFDAPARVSAIQRLDLRESRSTEVTNRFFEIKKRLERNKGVGVPDRRELFPDERFGQRGEISQADATKVTNEMASFVSERQQLLTSLSNTIKNLEEGLSLEQENEGATTALFPSTATTERGKIPDVLEHMIENESRHDLGPGSGSRFVIRENQIIDFTMKEVPPPYTLVQVNGLLGEGFVDPPSSFTTGNNGNAIVSGFAVDYDMWRMYGFKATYSVEAPFFSDPDTQCAPYAVALLNQARKNILQATIKLIGNEYYQAGDVVYVEDRDLLFYVESVKHSFSYGSNFTTTLELRYGHNPGEYIPTILDIIGKILYNSKEFTNNYRSTRFGNANGDIPVGSFIFDNKINGPGGLEEILQGKRGEQNKNVLNNLLFSSSGALNQVNFRGRRPKLQLRVYFKNNPDQRLIEAAEAIKSWLSNPSKMSVNSKEVINDNVQDGFKIPPDSVDIIPVDIESESTDISPSSSAWNSVRLLRSSSIPASEDVPELARSLDNLLFLHVIDAWMTFEEVSDSIETSKEGTADNQSAQEEAERVNEARRKLSE